ncbi:bZIP family transcription factor [Botrytis cinerea]
MNSSFDSLLMQQDDRYALTILTQAAMQTDTQANSNSPSNNFNAMSNATATAFSSSNPAKNNRVSTVHDTVYHSRATPISTSTSSSTIGNHPTNTPQYRFPPSISNLIGDHTRSRQEMHALAFNSTEQTSQGTFVNHPFQSSYSNNLGILNAEKYDDGRGSIRSHNPGLMGMEDQMTNQTPFGIVEKHGDSSDTRPQSEEPEQEQGKKRRKRVRKESSNLDDDDDEARKKARGRPRVDTKDETAADRRRTQIRMAQRAYRHRKETTISSLEKQVQELRGTNEEMNNIFINLYDFAISRGLLQREPEFGQQLQSTTQKFLELAKQNAGDENLRHEDDSPDNIAHESQGEANHSLTNHSTQRPPPVIMLSDEPTTADTINPWGGYIVSKDTSSEEERQIEYNQNDTEEPRQYEIISRATEENASFPFDSTSIQQYRAEIPSPISNNFLQSFYPYAAVPLPTTHSYFELSFARRVHRATVEHGYKLLTMPNPPKRRFEKAFGYCLQFETKEECIARFQRILNNSSKESLHEWRYPLLMPKFRTGFSMGPFPTACTPLLENISPNMKCTLPGFEGEFFDPNDVEGYLRGHGFDLQPGADYITGQIELEVSPDAHSPGTTSTDSVFPPTPRSPVGKVLDETNRNSYNLDHIEGDSNKKGQASAASQSGSSSPKVSANSKRYMEKRTVTIDVEILIRKLAAISSCLGRSPGYRRADLDAAIINAARETGFE